MTGSLDRIDCAGVGSLTRARTELLDVRVVSSFLSAIGEDTSNVSTGGDPSAFVVHPAIAFALQYRAQGRPSLVPAASANWERAVHASTDLRVHKPFRLGDVVTTQGRIIERRQIPPGVLNIERYRLLSEDAELLAELDFGLVFRGFQLSEEGVKLEEQPALPDKAEAVDAAEQLPPIPFPRAMLHNYTSGTGLYHAIHTDRAVARKTGFADIIVQGSALQAVAMSVLAERYFARDFSRITRFACRMRSPVLADTQATVCPSAILREAAVTTVFFDLLNEQGEASIADGVLSWRETQGGG